MHSLDGRPEGASALAEPASLVCLLHARCHERLLRLARRYERDPDIAHDLVQELWTKVWLHAPTPRSLDEGEAWLLRVARNSFIDHARRRSVRRRRHELLGMEWTVVTTTAEHEIVEEALAGESLCRRVTGAVETLPKRQREVVVARLLRGFSTAETAAMLDIAEGTVRATLFQACVALRSGMRAIPE